MKKNFLILSIATFCVSTLGTVLTNAETLDSTSFESSISEKASGSYKYVVKRYNSLKQIPSSYLYNSGGVYGYLPLKSWSYEKNLSTGKTYYEAIFSGYVTSGSGPIKSKKVN